MNKTITKILISFLVIVLVFFSMKGFFLIRKYYEYQKVFNELPDIENAISTPLKSDFNFKKKKWIHRVNSIQRAKIMADKYEGMEMDVRFDTLNAVFDVVHLPEPSIGLSLDKLFENIEEIKSHAFWLDFKNLTSENKVKACFHLITLVNKYGLHNRVIVESQNAEDLDVFANAGFYTSYYAPVFDLKSVSQADIKKYKNEMDEMLMKTKVHAISSSSSQLPFLEKYFPQYDKLAWHLDERKDLSYYIATAWLCKKEKLKVLLVNEHSDGYR